MLETVWADVDWVTWEPNGTRASDAKMDVLMAMEMREHWKCLSEAIFMGFLSSVH
ncbi:hypothetical protein HJFPF1_06695 [Paramyrothecium foliicola]|nr:hypothetical protein HJFPF1_06695 [Paramyrothecium foliicola]